MMKAKFWEDLKGLEHKTPRWEKITIGGDLNDYLDREGNGYRDIYMEVRDLGKEILRVKLFLSNELITANYGLKNGMEWRKSILVTLKKIGIICPVDIHLQMEISAHVSWINPKRWRN